MADATQGDTDVQSLGLLVPTLMALIAGLLIHSFIIGVNVSDWWKGRSVTAVDHIITSIGISRMCAQCVIILYIFFVILFPSSRESYVTKAFLVTVYVFFAYANVWITSLLSIVFCLKISNFHSRLFLYLRGLIIHRTGYLIVASGLLATLNSLMSFITTASTVVTEDGKYNTTIYNVYDDCNDINSIYIYAAGSSFPMFFCCISSVLLFSSLYHHTTKMKMSGNLSISLETYYSAMRFVSITFLYNTIYFIGHFVSLIYNYLHCVTLPWLRFVLEVLPVLHSSYLIYRTAKLRSQISKVLQYLADFLPQGKNTEIRENIEIVTQ